MSCFVISASDTGVVQSDVFAAGPDGEQEAVVAFTDRNQAQQYLDASRETGGFIVELSDADFVAWLVDAYQDGVEHLALDPSFEDHVRGRRVDAIDIAAQLEAAGAKILRVMRPDC